VNLIGALRPFGCPHVKFGHEAAAAAVLPGILVGDCACLGITAAGHAPSCEQPADGQPMPKPPIRSTPGAGAVRAISS